MSNSFRHHPRGGIAGCASEAWDKKDWHGRMRATARSIIAAALLSEDVDAELPDESEVSDPWNFNKDGKCFTGAEDDYKYYSKAWQPGKCRKLKERRRGRKFKKNVDGV